jgi:hypothetical protein
MCRNPKPTAAKNVRCSCIQSPCRRNFHAVGMGRPSDRTPNIDCKAQCSYHPAVLGVGCCLRDHAVLHTDLAPLTYLLRRTRDAGYSEAQNRRLRRHECAVGTPPALRMLRRINAMVKVATTVHRSLITNSPTADCSCFVSHVPRAESHSTDNAAGRRPLIIYRVPTRYLACAVICKHDIGRNLCPDNADTRSGRYPSV